MIDSADVVCGLAWGDEAKGKITSYLALSRNYDFVCRWAGGNNAGHTVYVDGKKYKTHLIPSGIFYGIPSIIGPGCVVNSDALFAELKYLRDNGFDSSLVKVSPKAHIITDRHIEYDRKNLAGRLGTTSKGIAPCYSAKAARTGIRAKDILNPMLLWDEVLTGNILCEGAQGIWLDLDHGNYPYVTSSTTLPYAACSLGFPSQKIRHIYGAAKIYDTRSGTDPEFPESLLLDPILSQIAEAGEEFGVTTGRPRKCKWLNLTKLIKAINMTGTTRLVISKCDILEKVGVYKLEMNGEELTFKTLKLMTDTIRESIVSQCPSVEDIRFSFDPFKI